ESPRRREVGARNRDILIFSDLDGTLLDHHTYRWDEARPALDRCRDSGIPVIMVSSKTRAEMESLSKLTGLYWPFISENGGGVFFPAGCPYPPPSQAMREGGLWVWPLGTPRDSLVRSLQAINSKYGWALRGFSDMPLEEISRITGLDPGAAERAARREFDEPFVASEELDIKALEQAASELGLRVTRGGRFFHLFGGTDKGEAVERLIDWFKELRGKVLTIGLGDGPNDIPMLLRVDIAVLIRSCRPAEEVAAKVPGIRITAAAGPAGWNEAVLELLDHHL
ncbi:MAG: HAD-IIB family hydrolase, partial [Desulfobacteraceae bacterium]